MPGCISCLSLIVVSTLGLDTVIDLRNFLFLKQVLRGLAYLREKHQIMHRGTCSILILVFHK